jgi:hypothetical protein
VDTTGFDPVEEGALPSSSTNRKTRGTKQLLLFLVPLFLFMKGEFYMVVEHCGLGALPPKVDKRDY